MTKILNVALNPELAEWAFPEAAVTYTKHALDRCVEKGLRVVNTLTIWPGEIVEAVLQEKKLVVRKPDPKGYDLVLVVVKTQDGWKVITSYKNDRTDTHKTLKLLRRAS
jgi:hypothetical protein